MLVGFVVFFGGLFVLTFLDQLAEIHDKWVFAHMTSEQHLWEARKSTPDAIDVKLALRHISALPNNSPEAAAAQVLKTTLEKKLSEIEADNALTAKAVAKAQRDLDTKAADAKSAQDSRSIAVTQFALDLKNVGYNLSVKINPDVSHEVVITSSDFSETDHRVRFLAFIRSKNSPAYIICLSGFTTIRLKASQIPFVGFDESYALDCFN